MSVVAKTKNVAVYEKLRQDIIKGRLKPGQRVVMGDLAKKVGSSETPVREAIRRLESEGYVIFTPHAGAVVTQIDGAALAEIYLIRIALEGARDPLGEPLYRRAGDRFPDQEKPGHGNGDPEGEV